MTKIVGAHRLGVFCEWLCHGHVWQLIRNPRYPERQWWFPTCPDCGAWGGDL